MRLTLRIKLLTVVAINALALLILVAASSLIATQVEHHLNDIRDRYLPRMTLRPQLERRFDHLQRGLQDAVAAADPDLLAATSSSKDELLAEITRAGDAIAPANAAALQAAITDYYDVAYQLSQHLITGEPEDLTPEIEDMQARRERAATLVQQVAAFDQDELAAAFASASAAQQTATRLRLLISAVCLIAVLALSLWISRGVLRRVGDLTAGFERFGEGEFDTRIPIGWRDELGDVAARANEMAASLQRLSEERSRIDWLKSGRAGLAQELRGALLPDEVANRAIGFLAQYLGAPVGAVYYGASGEPLRLLGGYALSDVGPHAVTQFGRGEGLVGQAARATDITVVASAPGRLRIRSGLAEGSAHAVVLVPLVHAGEVNGVIELGVLEPWSERHAELVLSVRETIAIAIEVARGRAATQGLLTETTAQARALEQQRVALETKNAELIAARQSLELKADELSAASRYKSQFLANMSHELRTPLNAIIGFAELLHDGVVAPDTPEHEEFLGDILTSGRHLLQLINDVLDLSKVEAGKLEFRPQPTDLNALIGEVLAILRTTAAGKRIAVEASVDPAVSEVVIDPARLKQVLYNYVSNALKFTGDGGRVGIRALPEAADSFRLEVEDTGIGLSAENLGRLFVEFQQLDGRDDKRQGGTGLGLALTKRLVEAQGGSVGARSRLGHGSVFHAVLPRQAELAPVTPSVRPVEAAAGAPAVLVIEDDPKDQRQLVEALARGGYSVEVASTGAQAVARCRERTFDAITLDVLLPDMSGVEVLRSIRAEGLNRDVPIVVITVVAEPGVVAGFAVHDILPKPLAEDGLLRALERAGLDPVKSGEVLVVDDDPGSLKLMAVALQQLGYRTRCERDAERALDAARDERPSAIVLDLLMPGMNGFEFLDRLRGDPDGKRVPVIVWTVMELSSEQHAQLRASAQAVVSKGNGGSAAVIAELAAYLPRETREAAM